MRASDRFAVSDVACRLAGRELPVRNLSVGGLYVEDDQSPPPPGQFVELELCLGTRPAFRVVGKITWRHESEGASDRPFGFGVQITRIDLRDKLALIDCLRRRAPVVGQPPPEAS